MLKILFLFVILPRTQKVMDGCVRGVFKENFFSRKESTGPPFFPLSRHRFK